MKKTIIYELLTTPGLSDQVPAVVSYRPELVQHFLNDENIRKVNFVSEHYIKNIDPTAPMEGVAEYIDKIIGRYSSSRFKIGKTNNPDNRASGYRGYTCMYLLRVSTSADLINRFEINLIDEFKGHDRK